MQKLCLNATFEWGHNVYECVHDTLTTDVRFVYLLYADKSLKFLRRRKCNICNCTYLHEKHVER